MDAGMEFIFEVIVVFIVVGGFLVSIAPAIILNIIWYKRVKSGKSKKFCALGIISIIVTVFGIVNLPWVFTMIGEYFGWV